MKQFAMTMVLGCICALASQAQSTTDSTRVSEGGDTLRVGNIIIVRNRNRQRIQVGDGNRTYAYSSNWRRRKRSPNITTNWIIVDLGFSNFNDKTNYSAPNDYLANRPGVAPMGSGDFRLSAGKSMNVNIWFFMQKMNLVKHHVNLKYGLGIELNNYRFRSNTSFVERNPFNPLAAPQPVAFRDSISFTKNKLAADYLTVPFMLDFTANPGQRKKGISAAVGVSVGFLYSQRNKQQSNERGREKNRGDFDLEPFRLSYIGEVGLGPVKLYGSYAPNSIFRRGLNFQPYNIGIRLSNWD